MTPVKPVTIVVLAKYKEIFQPFFESLSKFAPKYPKVLVRDGDDVPDPRSNFLSDLQPIDWTVIQGPETFSMAGNGNLGLKAVSNEYDILYCGDDIRFLTSDTIEKLQEAAYSDEKIGIISPRLIGRGSPTLVNPRDGVSEVKPLEMWFPCVYIKREVFDKIGYLDEAFNGFGSDDLDFCIRAKMAGYKLAVTSGVAVKHQASPEGGPTTFCKKIGADAWLRQQEDSYAKIRSKWSVSPTAFELFLATGDCKYLDSSTTVEVKATPTFEEGLLCSQQEAKEFLKTRHLHVATPAYGGWLSVNYINSLLSLLDMCADLGIKRTISFVYNESLITRARNKMAHDFLKGGIGTDFFFIDADIGFDARDIIMLMMRREDIIGAPCVRKNLRLDRIVEAVKKNGRTYTNDELSILTGEYVFNFPHDAQPSGINLGQMLEVLDVGTGLMRVRRETFDRFAKAYPDRWFLPMTGEFGGRVPQFMFFQAALDESTRAINPGGLPDYISEDYLFCRDARRAGMKVWLAPWLKTSHMGSHMYIGDLEAVAKVGGAIR